MSLILALNTALTGLNINQQALSVLSQNIANANTDGYTRKVLNQSATFVDGVGSGVKLEDITRKIDDYLQRAIQDQSAQLGKSTVMSTYLDRLQSLMGNPANGANLSATLQSFFNNVQSLAETPESSSARFNAVNAGVLLAKQVSTLASDLETLRFQADREIASEIQQVNSDLKELYSLNSSILNATTLGRSAPDLEDRRDHLLASISEKLTISVSYRGDGTVHVSTSGGIALLDDSVYQIEYQPAASASTFISNGVLGPMRVHTLNSDGSLSSTYAEITTSGASGDVTTLLTNGSIRGLMDIRDSNIPNVLSQLDVLASNLRDQVNAIHNSGSSFPGASSLTGTRLINAQDVFAWNGSVRIGLVDAQGQPVPSGYGDDLGKQPLEIDLATLNSVLGNSQSTVQDIVNEINQYYGVPQKRMELGNLYNVQLVSDNAKLPGLNNSLTFDFDLQNLSENNAGFFVTGVQVLDDTGMDITSVTDTVPSIALNGTGTYTTTSGSNVVTIASSGHGLTEGQRIYLDDPGTTINGIPAGSLTGYFTVQNVTENSFEVVAHSEATSGSAVDISGKTLQTAYSTAAAGSQHRTGSDGQYTASIGGNPTSDYYTINVTMGVDDGESVSSSVVTYRVYNNISNLLNKRYAAQGSVGAGEIVTPETGQAQLRAILVDANGNELPKVNGQYSSADEGYLKLVAGNGYYVVIDELDSSNQGRVVGANTSAATERGFSHFFEMNNFFASSSSNTITDTVSGSAINMAVSQRLVSNPGLITLGTLVQSDPAADGSIRYTYERNSGDNAVIQRLAALVSSTINFTGAGGFSNSLQTFAAYTGEVLGYSATQANLAASEQKSVETSLSGFKERSDAVSGVNLDEELANTVIYQNAYSASARVVTVSSELFQTLLDSVR